MPRPLGRGGIRLPAKRGRGSRFAARRTGVHHGSGERTLQQVDEISVKRPPLAPRVGGQPGVEVNGETESDTHFEIHTYMMTQQ